MTEHQEPPPLPPTTPANLNTPGQHTKPLSLTEYARGLRELVLWFWLLAGLGSAIYWGGRLLFDWPRTPNPVDPSTDLALVAVYLGCLTGSLFVMSLAWIVLSYDLERDRQR